jgi:uncharacterized protein YegP (UPF0339 family)
MRVELFKGEDGFWYFRFVAANNEIVATSEAYTHKQDARDTADMVRLRFAEVEVLDAKG